MNDVQKCQLNILKYFHDFCEKHQLKYFICGGTCLGAIRHKGFIPWDDDIDLMMPRPDYEKLIELGKKEMNVEGSRFFLQTYETDPNYLYNFMKIRDNSTTFVESLFKYANINHGVWIDIFPLDGLSSDIKIANKYLKKFHHTWYRTWISYLKSLIRKVKFKSCIKDIALNFVGYLFYFFNYHNRQNKKIDKITRKYRYEDSKYVASAQDLVKCLSYDKSIFEELILVPFETEMFYAPKRYDEYLTATYGDYMTPPPVDKQIGHHYTAYEDLHLSWKDFKQDYRKW